MGGHHFSPLDLFIEALPQGCIEFSPTGAVRRANARLRELLGLAEQSTLQHSFWTHVATAEDAEHLREALRQVEAPAAVEVCFRRPSGGSCGLRFDWLRDGYPVEGRAALVTEVSGRRAQEARLPQLELVEQRLRAVWAHNLEGISILDAQYRVLERNAVAERLTGFSIEDLQGRSFLEIVAPEDRQQVEAALGKALQGKPQHYQAQLCSRDSEHTVTIDTVVVPLLIEGQVKELISLSRDITERRRMQEELRRSKELLDLFFSQNLNGAFFMMLDEPLRWDESIDKEAALDYVFAHQRLTRVDQALLEQYGLAEQQMLDRTPAELLARDLSYGRSIWRRLFDTGRLHIELDRRRADGTPLRVEGDYICLYDEQGRITGHFGIQRDITRQVEDQRKLRRSEARYRSLFEHSLDGLLFYQRDGDAHRILAANPAACAMLGHSEAALMQRGLPLYLDPDDPAVLASISERTQTGAFRGELAARHADGRWLPFDVVAVEFPGQDGVTYGWTLFRDISERKQAEAALRQSRDDVRRLWALLQSVREEEQQHLALALQDELGQLLAVIKLDIGWLRRRLPNDVPALQNRLLDTEVMVDAGIEEIHRLSRQLRPRSLDDIGLVGACEALLSDLQRQHGLRAMLCLSHPELALESTLRTTVFRIVEEALNNVSRHAKASQVQVELLLEEDILTLGITDDGRGCDPEALCSAEATGLAEIRERVRLLGGRFSLQAGPGRGTDLRITLPVPSPHLEPSASPR
jgi:PAS domain S-box-containing protein